MTENNMPMHLLLREILKERSASAHCISYKELATLLGITQAPIILTVTKLLEYLIEEDVMANRPILSALAVQKGKKQLPRTGFFEKLDSLSMIKKDNDSFDESVWHKNELDKLKQFYKE